MMKRSKVSFDLDIIISHGRVDNRSRIVIRGSIMNKVPNGSIKSIVLKEIKDWSKECHIKKVILFGSRARGDFRRASDIDLAVKGGDIVRFTLKVKEDASTLLDFDVIDLDRCTSTQLIETIDKEGIVLYEEI